MAPGALQIGLLLLLLKMLRQNDCTRLTFSQSMIVVGQLQVADKNSPGDEIANVNFFTIKSYNTSKYNPLFNIQHDAGRCAASGCGLVVLVRHFSHAPVCCNKVRF